MRTIRRFAQPHISFITTPLRAAHFTPPGQFPSAFDKDKTKLSTEDLRKRKDKISQQLKKINALGKDKAAQQGEALNCTIIQSNLKAQLKFINEELGTADIEDPTETPQPTDSEELKSKPQPKKPKTEDFVLAFAKYWDKNPVDILFETSLPLGKMSIATAILFAFGNAFFSLTKSSDEGSGTIATSAKASGAMLVGGGIGALIPPMSLTMAHLAFRGAVIGLVAGAAIGTVGIVIGTPIAICALPVIAAHRTYTYMTSPKKN